MTHTQKLLTLAVLLPLTVSAASAANIVVLGQGNDREIWTDGGSKTSSQDEIRLGNSNNHMTTAVFGFALPELQPNETITEAAFSFRLNGVSNNPNGNVDLHGLGARSSSSAILASPPDLGDAYYGQLPVDDPYAVMLVEDFLTPSSASGIQSTDQVGGASSNLASYLNSLYTEGAPENTFVMVRLVLDSESELNSRYYRFATANDANTAYHPSLTITTVPEPATTAGLIGVAALGLAFVRRRLRAKK